MIDRVSTFADDAIIQMLKEQFIPVAIDQACERRQQDVEGEFYRKIAGQGPRNNFRSTTQGLYTADAAGGFLGYTNHRSPDRVKAMLSSSLLGFRAPDAKPIPEDKLDARYNQILPEGGLAIRVRAKVLGGYEPTDNPTRQAFQQALSRDNFWLTKQEHAELRKGRMSRRVQERLVRFHLVDNTRGEPPMWKKNEIRHLEIHINNGKITGKVHLETANGKRGYQAELLGFLETKGDQITRFDLIANGNFWGEGTYTRNAPPGRFPFAVSFTLADPNDAYTQVAPQAARGWLRGYLEN